MRRVALSLIPCLVFLACTWDAVPHASHSSGTSYRDPAGWVIQVPDGWHLVPFQTSKDGASAQGAQISNVELPPPRIAPGLPIQTLGIDLPPEGVSLVIAVDDDPSDVQQPPATLPSPPLSLDRFAEGSALPGSPSFALLWFSGPDSSHFLATVKTGAKATRADRAALAGAIASLRFDTSTT